MVSFRYRSVTRTGEKLAGEIEAPDRATAVARLQAIGQVPLAAEAVTVGSWKAALTRPLSGSDRIAGASLVALIEQLSSLLAAGIVIEQALDVMVDASDNAIRRRLLQDLLARLRRGESLATAMAAYRKIFSPIAVGMVRAGEAGGTLDTGLRRLADYLARREQAREAVRSALIYPAVLLVTAFMSVIVILTVVLPNLAPLFRGQEVLLPLGTRAVLLLGSILRTYWWAALLALAAAGVVIRELLANARLKPRRDSLLLRLPILGALVRKAEVARFTRTLGALISAGLPLSSALAISRPVLTNATMTDALDQVTARVKEGSSLSEPLARTRLFPKLSVQLVRIGETTGRLEEMLMKQADILDEEVQTAVKRLLTLLVPMITIAMGGFVAAIIASVLVALLGANDLVG